MSVMCVLSGARALFSPVPCPPPKAGDTVAVACIFSCIPCIPCILALAVDLTAGAHAEAVKGVKRGVCVHMSA